MSHISLSDYRADLGSKLIDTIIERGYVPADATGMCASADWLKRWTDGCVSILFQDPRDQPKRYLFGLIKKPARRRLLARIWFDNDFRRATARRWVVETSCTDDDLPAIEQLVKSLAKEFSARVVLRLEGNQTESETFLSDLDPYR